MQLTPQIREYFLEKEKVPKPQIRLLNGRYRVSLGKATDPIYYYGAFDTKAAAEAAAKKAVNERVKLFNEVREGLLNPQQAIKFLKKKGINVTPSNIARMLKTSGVETIGGKIGQQTLFKTPTDEQITQIKQNIYKDPKSELYKSQVPKRNRLVEKYLRQGLSRTDITNRVRQESPIGVTGETIDQIAKEKNITKVSGRTADGSKVVQNIKTQLKTLDKELKDIIRTGNYTTDGLINRTRKLLKLPNTANGTATAAYKLGQLVEAYSGDTQYINRTSPFLTKQSLKITQGLPQTKGYGGIKGALRRRALEPRVTQQLGESKTFFANVRRSLQKFLPSGINVDEVKNIASSGRYGTGPYSIFIQGLREDINLAKGRSIDQAVGDAEFKLQNLDPIEKVYIHPKKKNQKEPKVETKKQIIDEYNQKALDFENRFNKNLKQGELPVRIMKLSETTPKKTIQNKEAYNKFKDIFDDVHTKYGYSFEVPGDLKTVYDSKLREFLKSAQGQLKLSRFMKSGAGRAFAVPLAMYGAYQGLSTPVEAAEIEPTTQQIKFDEYNTATYPSDPLVREELEKIPEEPEPITPGLTTIAAAAGVAGAPEIKKAYSAARELGRGRLRSAFGLTGGLGALAGTTGTPLFTAAMDVPSLIDQIRRGESPSEILLNPGNYAGLAFMEPLSKVSGVIKPTEKLSLAQKAKRYFDLSTVAKEAKPGALSKVLRLGMSPRAIAGVTRFAGLPGLLISGGLTLYDMYNTYQQSKKSQGIDE